MAKIGSARIGENGRATGGARGDQTGNEVMIQDAYMHNGGWKILRAKDPVVANKLAFCMIVACDNPNTGYNQDERYLIFWTDLNVPTNCDCSTLVPWCAKKSGIDVNVDGIYTGNMIQRFLETGAFDLVPCNSINDMYTGDILVNEASHTGIVTEGHSRDTNTFDAPNPTLRRGSQGPEVVKLQKFYNQYCGCNLRVDGDFGGMTEYATGCFQYNTHIEIDGKYGQQTYEMLVLVLSFYGIHAV